MQIVLPAILAGLAFVATALAGIPARGRGGRVRRLAVAVAAGVLLGVSFVELVPEALELAGDRLGASAFAAGFGALFVVEALTRGHTHHDGPVERHPLGPFLIGLALHNVIDGVTIAASAELSTAAGLGVSLGVVLHQLPVGLSVAAVVVADRLDQPAAVRSAVLLGLAIPAGALIVAVLPAPGDTELGALLGFAAGALAYIAATHLVPEAHREHHGLTVALTFPAALASTALLFLFVLPDG